MSFQRTKRTERTQENESSTKASDGFIPPHGGYLRVNHFEEWSLNHANTRRLRELNRQPGANYDTFKKGIEHPNPAVAANVLIGLIKVTSYLLDQQIRRLERDFLTHGGLRERMTRARLASRARQSPPHP